MSHSQRAATAPSSLLVTFWLCVVAAGCGDCSSNTAPPEGAARTPVIAVLTQDSGTPPNGTKPPKPSEPRELDGLEFDDAHHPENSAPWMKEAKPFPGSMYLAAGKPDFGNQYPSTVMVSRLGPLEAAQCSGVLLTPSLVLTAANCVCRPRKVTSPEGRASVLFDTSSCANDVYVTTADYGDVVNEYIAATDMHSIQGRARPHPDFKLVLDEHRAVVLNHADLAVIVLREPVKARFAPAPLSDREVSPLETLVMAGYGYGSEFGQIAGLRFIRKDKVLGGAVPGSSDRFLYEQQGAFLYRGFKGGPCFRQEGGRDMLVGIASLGTPEELSLTTTAFYRDWLESELRQISKAAPEKSP